jgi:hypothetical protein
MRRWPVPEPGLLFLATEATPHCAPFEREEQIRFTDVIVIKKVGREGPQLLWGDEPTATSAMPRKTVKPDIPMLLARCSGLFAMAIPAGRKRQSDHEAQKTQAEIGEEPERGEYRGPFCGLQFRPGHASSPTTSALPQKGSASRGRTPAAFLQKHGQ